MATAVEIIRQKAVEAKGAFLAEFEKYGEDNLPSAEQEKHVDELRSAMIDAARELDRVENFIKSNRESADRERQRIVANPAKADSPARTARMTLGAEFVDNPSFKEWMAMIAPSGSVPEKVRLNSPGFEFKGFADIDRRSALITGDSATSAGAFVLPDYYSRLTEIGTRALNIRSVITNLVTGSDTVEFTRETAATNNAAAVAEATDVSGSTGVKPQSELAYEKVSTPVKTVAHWIPATRRALSDASQIRGLIDAFLRYGLDEALEEQILVGDGVGENFDGITETANTQAQAWDTDLFVTLRKAKRKVRTVGRRTPNAYILNPEDWERCELAADNQNRFYGNGPFGETAPSVWRLPVVESEFVPVGTGLVGDFSTCVVWDREQATLSVSDSHQDFFVRNLIAILAELRAAFGVLKPNAIVEIDLTA